MKPPLASLCPSVRQPAGPRETPRILSDGFVLNFYGGFALSFLKLQFWLKLHKNKTLNVISEFSPPTLFPI
jgi:hypothetical protein